MTALFPMYRFSAEAASCVCEYPFYWPPSERMKPLPLESVVDAPVGWSSIDGARAFKTLDDRSTYLVIVKSDLAKVPYCASFFDGDGKPREDLIEAYVP